MKKILRIFGVVILTILFVTVSSSCGKDDAESLQTIPSELLGTWIGTWEDEDDIVSVMFNADNTGVWLETTSDGDMIYYLSFNFTISGNILEVATLRVYGTNNHGESEDGMLVVTVYGNQLIIYDEGDVLTLYKSGSHIPVEPVDKGRDELSNTSWRLQSITGWALSATSEWKDEVFDFGNNGEVTEIYNDGGSASGSYTLSGNTIKFSGIPYWTNNWGSSFSYTLSGNTLKLDDNSGSIFNFVKN